MRPHEPSGRNTQGKELTKGLNLGLLVLPENEGELVSVRSRGERWRVLLILSALVTYLIACETNFMKRR